MKKTSRHIRGKTAIRRIPVVASLGLLGFLATGSAALADRMAHPSIAEIAPMMAGPVMVSQKSAQKSAAQQGSEKFVASLGQRGIDFLGNEQQTEAQKTESFRRLLEDSFDLDAIGRFALGVHWRQATPEQRSEYLRLFKRSVIDMYAQRFSEYNGQKLVVSGSRPAGNEANDTVVLSKVISTDGSDDIPVEWVVQGKGNTYKVLDVFILGTSQSMNQRNQFRQIIQRGGGDVQVLIDHLKSRF